MAIEVYRLFMTFSILIFWVILSNIQPKRWRYSTCRLANAGRVWVGFHEPSLIVRRFMLCY